MTASGRSALKFVLAPLIASLAMMTVAGSAAASTPTLMWSGAKRVNILCNVAGGPGIDHLALTRQICSDVMRLAAKGAPLPVATIVLGDPTVLASDAVTLLVHASVTTQGQNRLMAFSIRPHRTTTADATVLFGAPPRAILLSSRTASSADLSAALAAALAETLPWLARPSSPQRIHQSN